MKTLPISILFLAAFFLGACAKQIYVAPPITPSPNSAKDTLATLIFVNKRSMEIRLGLSYKSSVREGYVVTNTWHNLETHTLPKGDSVTLIFKAETEYMYTVYGPVSSSPSGWGVVDEAKFTLSSGEMRRKEL
jgi:hypothetical protein